MGVFLAVQYNNNCLSISVILKELTHPDNINHVWYPSSHIFVCTYTRSYPARYKRIVGEGLANSDSQNMMILLLYVH